MSPVITEGTNLNVAPEVTRGTTPTTGWTAVQVNSYGDFGASMKKVARTPISKNRQNQRPILTDLDSAMPFQSDLTKDVFDAFLSGWLMSQVKHSGGTGLSFFRPTAVTATGYTVAASGALAQNILIVARNFSTAANNGVKVLGAGSIATEIKTAGLTAEAAPPSIATVDVAGVQGAAGDIGIDASGNLTSAANIWTGLGLNVGQWIRLGDLPSGAAFAFSNVAYVGTARIKAIAAGTLTLERRSWTVGAPDAGAAKTIRVFFSRWCRNVAIDHADYVEPSYGFEVTYPNLGGVGVPEYIVPVGNLSDEVSFNLPLTDKATVDLSFIGMNTPDQTSVRPTGAANAIPPTTQIAVSTATDLPKLRVANVDESGISTDFKSIKITAKNNVNPEKQLGQLGAAYMNVGRFELMVEFEAILVTDTIIKAIRDNREAMIDVLTRNADFGALFDCMSVTLDEGDQNLATNESVKLKTKATGFQNNTLNSTLGISVFAYLPAS